LSIGICIFGLFTLVFWLPFCTHFPIKLSKWFDFLIFVKFAG
jgi:hypothetical protein